MSDAITRYEYGRAIEALRAIMELFADGTFVRNVERDGEFSSFARSAFKTAGVLAEAQKIVQESESLI